MYHYSSVSKKSFLKAASPSLLDHGNLYSRDIAFDPLNYEFDADTMIEPFTYFQDGPAESRRKPTIFSSISSPVSSTSSSSYPWSPASSISPLEENAQSYYPPINHMLPLKHPQPPARQSAYPKTICLHCKSHNMPECLYTSHSMYDESGEIFCPVLKKCHCATCIRVINSTARHEDDSDDDNHLRYPGHENEYGHFHSNPFRANSYRTINTNNNF